MPRRVQVLSRLVNHEHVKVQLWDVAGGPQFQHLWPVLSQVRLVCAAGACA
jgi:hypothetical protein